MVDELLGVYAYGVE
jgi:hypothetical protein